MFNEICFYIVSFLYICFTDINPDANSKLLIGWLVLILIIGNLIYPNGIIMVSSIWPEIKETCFPKRHKRVAPTKLENKRQDFIRNYRL